MKQADQFGIDSLVFLVAVGAVRQNINNKNREINIIKNTLEKQLVFKQLPFIFLTDAFLLFSIADITDQADHAGYRLIFIILPMNFTIKK